MTGRGFSLIELLVVMAMAALLLGLVVPSFNSISQSMGVTQAGEQIKDQIIAARQLALTHSLPAEVRFYSLPKPNNGTAANSLCATQLFMQDAATGAWKPQGRILHFPQGIIVRPESTASPLLSLEIPASDGDPVIADTGRNYKYRRVGFLSGGRPNSSLPQDPSSAFLTAHRQRDGSDLPPPNYSLIHVDAVTGRTRLYRPQ